MIQSVLIVSGGAMGSLFSGFLKAASIRNNNAIEVILRANWKDHREAIQKNGLQIQPLSKECQSIWNTIQQTCHFKSNDSTIFVPVETCEDDVFDNHSSHYRNFDSVLLLDKSYNTRSLAKLIKKVLKKDGTCLTLQNGMGNVEILQEELGENRVLQGNTSHGAMLLGPGCVRHAGTGYITISSPSEEGKQAASWWVNQLQSISLSASLADDNFHKVLWEKLLVNAVINPLTALFNIPNGKILDLPDYDRIANEIVKEGVTVASQCGIELDLNDCLKRVHLVAEQTAGNCSSMLGDIRKKTQTEVDFMNGYIVKMGKEKGIKTPTNSLLTSLIHMKEVSNSF